MKRLAVNMAILALLLGLMSNVALATPIPVTAVTASSYYDSMLPERTIDGSGLSGTFPNQTHNTEYLDMWMTTEGEVNVANPWIQFDLGAEYNLASAHIWNFNQYTVETDIRTFDLTNRGIHYVDILVSTDLITWNTVFADAEFPQAPGLSSYAGFDLDFGGTLARYVKFDINSNYGIDSGGNPGAGNYVGLSEVQFAPAAVPEPATMLLLGSGLIGMGAFVRRKFKR